VELVDWWNSWIGGTSGLVELVDLWNWCIEGISGISVQYGNRWVISKRFRIVGIGASEGVCCIEFSDGIREIGGS
jgi:hypothetical protein